MDRLVDTVRGGIMRQASQIFSPCILAVVAATILSGCENLTSPARDTQLNGGGPYWLDYSATRRGTLVVPSDKLIKTCAEPSPDVALSTTSNVDAALKAVATPASSSNVDATAKLDFAATVVELQKRTQMVSFLRESLFRLCEQSLNQQFTSNQVLLQFADIIKAARDLAETDAQIAIDKANKSALALKNAPVQQTIPPAR
ncbi:hypothetical protein [Ralstonia solanacearum]|uniref:hypothetical protein n=1 Tax=Ralstonia solanacearum TaxID=305 RepID=UPI000F606308|nr:hypothetical protein [Ralstonia solanacearum]